MCFCWRYCSTNLTLPLLSSCATDSKPGYCCSLIHAVWGSCLHRAHLALPVSWLGCLISWFMATYFHSGLANPPRKDHQQPQPISYLPDPSHIPPFPPQNYWEACSCLLLHSSPVSWIPCSSGNTVSPALPPVTVDYGALMKWPSKSHFFPYSGSPGNSSRLQHPLRCLFIKNKL